MTTPEKPTVEQLLESLETLRAQQEILGPDTVGPVIEQLTDLILDSTPKPSEEQSAIYKSWNTLRETSDQLGIDMPEPTSEISAAVEATEAYNRTLERIGGLGSVAVAQTEPEVIPVPESASVETQPTGISVKDTQVSKTQTAESTPPEPAEAPKNLEIEPERTVRVTNGRKEIEIPVTQQEAAIIILEALASSEDGVVETADLMRSHVGTTSTELTLALSGKMDLPQLGDLQEARRKRDRFYRGLNRLRDNGFIDVDPGNLSSPGQGPKSGRLFRKGNISIIHDPETGSVVAEIERLPYKVSIDSYTQTIDNGAGQQVKIDKDPSLFKQIVKALELISSQDESSHDKFTRSDIIDWSNKEMGKAVSLLLLDVIDSFDGDFPLQKHGNRGGAYYSFDHGSEINITESWPEKPDFDNPAYVSFKGGLVQITIDGQTHDMVDYEDSRISSGVNVKGNAVKLAARNKAMFGALSMLTEKTDQISLDDLTSMVIESDDDSKGTISSWIRRRLNALNDQLSEHVQLSNIQKFGNTVEIDLNRRIVIIDDEVDAELPEKPAEIEKNAKTAMPLIEISPVAENNDHKPVAPRKDAFEVARGIDSLDENKKKQILGRLVHNSRYEFPETLEEAAYLLELVMDKRVMAEVRESSRFASQKDDSDFKNFKAHILEACYFRTLSWGSFEDLVRAVEARSEEKRDLAEYSSILSFSRQTASEISDLASSENQRQAQRQINDKYVQQAVESMVDGGEIPRPTSPLQAIALLQSLRQYRATIAEGKTQTEFNSLVKTVHNYANDQLGYGNARETIRSNGRAQTVTRRNRAGLVSGGEENSLLDRTDGRRFPDRSNGGRRRRRGSRSQR